MNKLFTHGGYSASLKLAMGFYLVWKTQLTQGNREQKKETFETSGKLSQFDRSLEAEAIGSCQKLIKKLSKVATVKRVHRVVLF